MKNGRAKLQDIKRRIKYQSINERVSNELNRTQRIAISKDISREFYAERNELLITDHAIVRYLERVHGLDVAMIREELLKVVPKELGNGKYPIPNSEMVAIVKEKAIVTIVPSKYDRPIS